ncbi:MAG: transposase [Thermoguttaceae bacterium]|jgi:SRSO17 transposase
MRARLEAFAQPFIANLCHAEQREHAKTYLEGLVSDVERKNAESIAYRHDEHRLGLQKFLGMVLWEHRPLRDELARIIRRAWACDTPARIARESTRRLQRNELARFYHNKTRNRLPRRKSNQRK